MIPRRIFSFIAAETDGGFEFGADGVDAFVDDVLGGEGVELFAGQVQAGDADEAFGGDEFASAHVDDHDHDG